MVQLGKDAILDNASYSMMHFFEEGFSIVLYTCTHSSFKSTMIHRNHVVRLILGKNMVLIWHARLLYSGARTRFNAGGKEGRFKIDMLFFVRMVRTTSKCPKITF